MKKSLLALALSLGILATGHSQIVITEIMYNPPEANADSLEFVEVLNIGNSAVELTGWKMTYGASSFTVPPLDIAPAQYRLFSVNASALMNNFGVASTQWTSGALGNNGTTIRLSDASMNVMDEVMYSDVAPWPTSPDAGGASLVLCDPASDNNLPGSWQAAATPTSVVINGIAVFANPGAASSCMGNNQISATDDVALAPTGQTTLFHVQANDLIVSPITSFLITTPPTHGSATVSGNSISYLPNAGYCGPDQLMYQICDAANCDDATVSIAVKCYPQRSIAQVTGESPSTGVADSLNVNCELQGTVYGVNLRPINANQPALLFTIIDNNGDGMAVSSLGGQFGYTVKEKDIVAVRGTITQFNGQTEIRPDTVLKISGNNPLLVPTVVTTLTEATESKLVKINNLHFVDPAEWTTGVGASGFNVRIVSDNSPADTILLRIDRDVETYNSPVPPQPFNLTGIGGQFDPTNPFTTGYQILPRYNADISTLMPTSVTDYSAEVSISPNPVTDLLSIEMSTGFDRITLLRANGNVIKTYRNPGTQQKVDVSLLDAGTYFVRFEKNGKAWMAKIVKQ